MAVGRAVPVIASFDGKGNFKPVRIRAGETVLVVEQVTVTGTQAGMTKFTCIVNDGEYRKEIKTVFREMEKTWHFCE